MAKLPKDRTLRIRVLYVSGVVAGLGLGAGTVVSLSEPDIPIWYFWAPLALVLSTSAGAAPGFGLAAIHRLEALRSLRTPQLVTATMAVVLVMLIVVNLPWLLSDPDSIVQNGLLISWTVLAGSPIALALLGIRQVVTQPTNVTTGEQIELLLELRRLARSLVVGGGALTALVTLQSGAVMSLQREIDSSYGRPQQYVLVIGMVGTLLVGGLYVPTRAALQDRALDLARSLAPLTELDDAEGIEKSLDRRKMLLGALEADRNLLSELQADLVVWAPLIASAAAVTLPRSG